MARTWRTVVGLAVAMALIGLPGVTSGAGQAEVAERLLQQALTKEVVEQDLAAAIRLYEQVLATPGVTSATADRARERLAALRPQASQNDVPPRGESSPAPRRVLDGEWTELYDMSADGTLVVGQRVVKVRTQEVVVRALSTGELRVIGMGGAGPEISDDGTRVAYGLGAAVWIGGTEVGASPVRIAAEPGVGFRAHDFAPDGQAVLVSSVRMNDPARSDMVEYAWVSVADRSVRSIRSLERWRAPSGGGSGHASEPEVSPDGRFIAFVATPAPGSQDRYVYVMDSDGQQVEPVVSTSGQRGWPKWTPDGRSIVFTEEHRNGAGLWSVAVENGRAAGQPRLLHGNIGSDSALLGITRDGVLHYRRNDFGSGRHPGSAAHVVSRTLSTATSQARPTTFRGCCAGWSPDGQRLAYAGDDGKIVIRHVETGEERSYDLRGASGTDVASVQWFPDASAVLVVGVDDAHSGPAENNESLNYYRIDLDSGAVSPVLSVGPLRSWSGALSKDGRTLYVAKRDVRDGPFTQIVSVDIAAGTETSVVALPAGITPNPGIVVSPDGTALAVGAAGSDYETDGRLFTVNVDGTDVRDVGGGGISGFWGGEFVRWLPDGRSLLFRSYDADEDWRIMRISANGGVPEFDGVGYENLSPLVPDRMVRGNFNGLDVSPDGTRLVVSTLVAPRFEVWALDLSSLIREEGLR